MEDSKDRTRLAYDSVQGERSVAWGSMVEAIILGCTKGFTSRHGVKKERRQRIFPFCHGNWKYGVIMKGKS